MEEHQALRLHGVRKHLHRDAAQLGPVLDTPYGSGGTPERNADQYSSTIGV